MSLYLLPNEIFYFKVISKPKNYLNIRNETIFSVIIDKSIYNNITKSIIFGGIFSYLSISDFVILKKVSRFFREKYFLAVSLSILEEFYYYEIMKKYLDLSKYYDKILIKI